MSLPQSYIDGAKTKLSIIDSWFAEQVQLNPTAVLSLVKERGSRIEREIYAEFRNSRRTDYEALRDDNTIRLKCRAGRGGVGKGVPKDSRSATVEADNSDWIVVPEQTYIDVHNNIAGGSSFNASEDRRKVDFEVHCKGVSWSDTTRNHGAHEATLHAIFKMTPDAIEKTVNLETIELGNIIGN